MADYPAVNPEIPSFKDWGDFCQWDDINILKNRKGSQLVMTTSDALREYKRGLIANETPLLSTLLISRSLSFQYMDVDPNNGELPPQNHKRVPPASMFMGMGSDKNFCFYLLKLMKSDAIPALWAKEGLGKASSPYVPSVPRWDLTNLGATKQPSAVINPDIPAFHSLGDIWKHYDVGSQKYMWGNQVVVTTTEALNDFYLRKERGFASLGAMSLSYNKDITACSVQYSAGEFKKIQNSTTGPSCNLFKRLGSQSDARFYVLRTSSQEDMPQLWASKEQIKAGLSAA